MTTCITKNTVAVLQRYVVGKVYYCFNGTIIDFIIKNGYLPTWRYRISKNALMADFNNGKSSTALAFEIYNCYKSYITKIFFK